MKRNQGNRAYASLDTTYSQYRDWCAKFKTRPRNFGRWLMSQVRWTPAAEEEAAYRKAAERLRQMVGAR